MNICVCFILELKNVIQKESSLIQQEYFNKLIHYNIDLDFCVPDFSIGIISKELVCKIINTFGNIENIINLFDVKFTQLWIYQVLFGYILFLSNIEISDISKKNINLFYGTGGSINICNFDAYSKNPEDTIFNGIKMDIPICVPIELFYNNQDSLLIELRDYILEYDFFMNRYHFLNMEMQKIITNPH
jgi:hypothetical protein